MQWRCANACRWLAPSTAQGVWRPMAQVLWLVYLLFSEICSQCATGALPHWCAVFHDLTSWSKNSSLKITSIGKKGFSTDSLSTIVGWMDERSGLRTVTFLFPYLVPVTHCSCVNRSLFWQGRHDQTFAHTGHPPQIRGGSWPYEWWRPLRSCMVWRLEKWHSDMAVQLHSQVLRLTNWFHLL